MGMVQRIRVVGWRSRALLGVALFALAAPIQGQAPTWVVRAEAGWVNVHGSPDPGPVLGGAGQRRFGSSGVVGLEAALAVATADETLVGFSVGPEVRLFPARPVSPFAVARVGGALEESELGWLVETRIGIVYRSKGAFGVTAAFAAGWHGADSANGPATGPTGFILGVEWGLGRRGGAQIP